MKFGASHPPCPPRPPASPRTAQAAAKEASRLALPLCHGSFPVSSLRGQFCVLQCWEGRAALRGRGGSAAVCAASHQTGCTPLAFSIFEKKQNPHPSIFPFLKSHQSFSSCITPSPLAAVSLAPRESGGRLCAVALGNHRAVASEPLPPLEKARSPARMMLFKHKQAATSPCLQLWNISLHRHRGSEKTQQAPGYCLVLSFLGKTAPGLC